MFEKPIDNERGVTVVLWNPCGSLWVSTGLNLSEDIAMDDQPIPWWRNPSKLLFGVFLVIGAYFMWTEHRAHVIEWLPWVLVLACVGMHLFMHGGHRHRNGQNHGESNEASSDRSDEGGRSR